MSPSLRTVVLILAVAVAPGAAAAQPPSLPAAVEAVTDRPSFPTRFDISLLAGPLVPTDWSDTVVLGSIGPLGTVEQVVVRDLGIEPDAGFDAAATYWRGRWGFRVHGAFSSSCIAAGGACPEAGGVDADTWLFDVGGAFSLRPYSSRQRIRPYLFAGVGGVAYNLDRTIGPDFLTIVGGRPSGGAPVVVVDEGGQFLLSVDELGLETSLAGTFGFGTDIRIPLGGGGLGVRLEVADHVARSPVNLRLTTFESGRRFDGLPETEVEFDAVHHFRLSAGLVVDLDLKR